MASGSSSKPLGLSPSSPPDISISTANRTEQPRQRAIRACQLCRTRRVKCDNKKPRCSGCVKAGVECIQNQRDNAAVVDPGARKILQRIDDLENILKSFQPPGGSSPEAVKTSENLRTSQINVTTEELLSWTVFRGHYDDSRDLKGLLRSSTGSNTATSPATVDSSHIFDELDSVSTKHLVDQFFRHVHVKNPMLDEMKLRQMVHRLSLDGPTWEPASCLALLVCALGSIASSFDAIESLQSSSQPTVVANSYFSAAQRRIGTISGAGGVLEAQCYFYSGVYLMTTLQPLRAWRCFTQALACCQDFACANPSYPSASIQSSLTKRGLPAEESVYWSCWKSEQELRMYLNLPDYAVGGLSYPLLFPTPPESMASAQAASWYFYLSEISLRRLEHRCREEIGNILGKGGVSLIEDLSKSTRTLEELATQWVETLPPAMSLHTSQEMDDVLKFILRGHLLNLWEVIYWPWLEIYINHGVHDLASNLYGQKALQTGIDRIRINKPGFRHRHHGTWLMLQSCTRSALLLIAANYDVEASTMLPHGWQEAVSDTIELLRFWQYEATDVADRLRILEELTRNISI
jgi:Fungal Zn(2)-Cys(6) binuclear cluster domain